MRHISSQVLYSDVVHHRREAHEVLGWYTHASRVPFGLPSGSAFSNESLGVREIMRLILKLGSKIILNEALFVLLAKCTEIIHTHAWVHHFISRVQLLAQQEDPKL